MQREYLSRARHIKTYIFGPVGSPVPAKSRKLVWNKRKSKIHAERTREERDKDSVDFEWLALSISKALLHL